jgi:hypothetical protein
MLGSFSRASRSSSSNQCSRGWGSRRCHEISYLTVNSNIAKFGKVGWLPEYADHYRFGPGITRYAWAGSLGKERRMPKPRGSKAKDLALGTPLVVNLDRQIMGVLTAGVSASKVATGLVRTALASGQLLMSNPSFERTGAASRVCDERSGQNPKHRTAVDSAPARGGGGVSKLCLTTPTP